MELQEDEFQDRLSQKRLWAGFYLQRILNYLNKSGLPHKNI